MKKTRFLVIVLALSILILGAGYAAWTDTLNITSTVKTGHFNVDFVKPKILGFEYNPAVGTSNVNYNINDGLIPGRIEIGEIGYTNAELLEYSDNLMRVRFSNLYPGSLALVSAKMRNKSSIPAKFGKATVTFGDGVTEEMKDTMMTAGGFVIFNYIDERIPLVRLWDPIEDIDSFAGVKLRDLEDKINEMLAGVKLDVNESIIFDIPEEDIADIEAAVEAYDGSQQNCFLFYLPSTVSSDTTMNQTVEFSINIEWVPFNN